MTAPGAAARPARRTMPLGVLVPLALALVAEAAWIAVLAGLLDSFALHAPATGIPELLAAAVAGLVAARALGPRLGDGWSRVAVVLAVAAGAVGWLASPEVRALLRANGVDGLGDAVAANPGGWLLALAFVRGMAHARLPVDAQRLGTMIAVGVPGLALAAIVGGMIGDPWRGAFLATAQFQVLVFLAAGIGSLALARLTQVADGVRIDWRRNPAWLVLLGALVLVAALGAAWIGASAGTTIATAAGALLVPLLVVGFVAGFDRYSVRLIAICLLIVAAVQIAVGAISSKGGFTGGAPALSPPTEGNPQAQQSIALGALAVVLVVAVLVVMLLARLWLRRSTRNAVEEDEERTIDRGGELDGTPATRRRASRLGRRSRPSDAVEAWLALIASLEGRPPVERGDGETPAEHARRLRAAGHGTLALDLLAADVGLTRFGRIELGASEQRRAIARARTAGQALLAVPVDRDAVTAGATATAPTGPVTRGGRKAAGPGADITGDDQPGAEGSILTRIRRGF